MKILKAEGGRAVAVRLDAASLARLDFLEAYFRAHGLQVSNSALVRRALSALTEEVSKLVLRERKEGPEDGRVVLAALRMTWDARNSPPPCPWRKEPPAPDDRAQYPRFPTWDELKKPLPAKPPALVPFATNDESLTTDE